MQFLVLTVLASAAGAMGQLTNPRGLGQIGANVGGKLGTSIGGGFGSVFDTALSVPGSVLGIFNRPKPVAPSGPYGPRPGTRPGSGLGRPGYGSGSRYESGGRNGERYNERGSSTRGRQGYEGQGSAGEYEKGGSYAREKTVHEREQGKGFDAGRGSQGSGRGGSEGRADSYGRDSANYGSGYVSRDERL